ncbi:MAG: hypothetical protein FJ100_12350 [Deltaproteobacteria bacterium]|nr:hypothetical protein [Deltaproteobacteria bacterium]
MTAHPDEFRWDLGTPLDGDRAVRAQSRALAGKTVALLLSGGIAAYRAPDVCRALRAAGARVYVYATPTALQFVAADALQWTALSPVVTALDGRAQHVEHAPDAYLVAPATYSTLNKVAAGVADNAVTTALASALGRLEQGDAKVLLAPTMHGSMVNSILRESLAKLANLGCVVIPPRAEDGKAKLPEVDVLVAAVVEALARA